jgi:hypothetical protein
MASCTGKLVSSNHDGRFMVVVGLREACSVLHLIGLARELREDVVGDGGWHGGVELFGRFCLPKSDADWA